MKKSRINEEFVYFSKRCLKGAAIRLFEPVLSNTTLANWSREAGSPFSQEEVKARLIFVHIPKTAGNTVTQAVFGTTGRGHFKLREYHASNPSAYNQYFKFAFTRNPWDRLVSAFHYLKQGGMSSRDKIFANEFLSNLQFDEFVLRLQADESFRRQVMSWIHFIPQVDFLMVKGVNGADFVGKAENLEKDLSVIGELLDRELHVESFNTSVRRPYREYYLNGEMVDIVGDLYKDDVDTFGYVF